MLLQLVEKITLFNQFPWPIRICPANSVAPAAPVNATLPSQFNKNKKERING